MKTSLGVDITDEVARVVLLRAKGSRPELLAAASFHWSGETDREEIASQLQSLVEETGVARPRLVVGLPASGCSIKTAELPPAKAAELAKVVKFEAETQFPLPLEQLVWDFTTQPLPSGRQHAVMVGARRSLVEKHLSLLSETVASSVVFLPDFWGAAAAVSHPAESHLLIMAKGQWSDLCLFTGEHLWACRSVSSGSSEAEGWAKRLAWELRPWLTGAERALSVHLVGEMPPEAVEELSQAIGVPVVVADLWERIRDPGGLLQGLGESPRCYAAALALAQAGLRRDSDLNLLPASIKEAESQRRRSVKAVSILAVLAVLLVPATWGTTRTLHERQAQYQTLVSQVQEVRQSQPSPPSSGVLDAFRALEALETQQSHPIEILALLSRSLPGDLALTDFTYDRDKSVLNIRGYTASQASVAGAVSALAHLRAVERATLDHATAMKSEVMEGYEFQISCLLAKTNDPTLGTARTRARGNTRSGTEIR